MNKIREFFSLREDVKYGLAVYLAMRILEKEVSKR